jgi:hypothetical protein
VDLHGNGRRYRGGGNFTLSSGQGTHRTDLVPSEFYLSQNHPNAFSEKTTVKFCVATRTRVTLEVLNPEGEIVGTLLDEEKEPGTYETEFDALHISGGERGLPDGVYIYRLRAADFSASKRMILLRERTSASLPGHPFRTFHNS